MNMKGESPVIPDLGQIIKKTVRDIQPEKTEGEKEDETWAELGRYPGWKNLLKPYLEERMASLKSMAEVRLTGRETVKEVGTRFLICSAVASELQSLIDRVELTRQVLDKRIEAEKEVAKAMAEKELVKEKKAKKKKKAK